MRTIPHAAVIATAVATLATLATLATPLAAQHSADHGRHHAPGDTAFAALQARGARHMGVDQYASTHRFDALPDGGRIELRSDAGDSAAVASIRAHLRAIAAAFTRGDFTTPGLVHVKRVPGASVMAAKRGAITYETRDLPRGAEVRIRTGDADAVRAIAEFMAFQRDEHRAGGRMR